MARRKLSTRGRVLAAGACVGVTGLLAGLMAATDTTGNASADIRTGVTAESPSGSRFDGSYDADGDGRTGDPGDYSGVHGRVPDGFSGEDGFSGQGNTSQPSFPQPHTRSGGS